VSTSDWKTIDYLDPEGPRFYRPQERPQPANTDWGTVGTVASWLIAIVAGWCLVVGAYTVTIWIADRLAEILRGWIA
jgi:hypothetical protein